MAKRSTKHSKEQQLRQSDFGGGLNLVVNTESLAENELSQAENWEYEFPTNKLKTREGLELVKDMGVDIETLFYADNHDAFYFSSNTTLYDYVNGIVTNLGTLTGNDLPKYAIYDNMVLIASGQALQSYDGIGTLDSTGSPDADMVFTRVGRVVIAKAGTDKLIYSGVGDVTNWTAGTDSDMIEVDVGYKDGGDIIAVVPLASDVVIFKSSGSIFRLVSEYPDWALYEITRSQSAYTRFATVQVGNEVFFLAPSGFMSLKAVTEYGNVKTSMEGYKINNALVEFISSGARIWSVLSKGQIWVRPTVDEQIWVYHIATGAWTKFKMLGAVTGHCSLDGGEEYVSIGQKLYKIGGTQDEGVDFNCYLKSKKYVARNQYLLKRITVHYYGYTEAVGSVSSGLLTLNINIPSSGDIAFSDTDIAYSDTDKLVSVNLNKVETRTSYRSDYVELFVKLDSGSIVLKELILNIVEV